MNALGIDFTADQAGIIADLPVKLTIGARKYDVLAGAERRALDVIEEGRYNTYERPVMLPLSALKSLPTLKTTVTLDEIKYRVDEITTRDRATDSLVMMLRRDDGG